MEAFSFLRGDRSCCDLGKRELRVGGLWEAREGKLQLGIREKNKFNVESKVNPVYRKTLILPVPRIHHRMGLPWSLDLIMILFPVCAFTHTCTCYGPNGKVRDQLWSLPLTFILFIFDCYVRAMSFGPFSCVFLESSQQTQPQTMGADN